MEVIGGLAGVITHSAAAVSCTGPGATCSGSSPGPGQWTPPSLLLVTPGGAPLVTGHSMCLLCASVLLVVLLSPVRLLLAD